VADDIARLDPYTSTLEELRHKIIGIVGKRLPRKHAKNR